MWDGVHEKLLALVGFSEKRWLYFWFAISMAMVGFVASRLPLVSPEVTETWLAPGEAFKFTEEDTSASTSHPVLAVHVVSVLTWSVCGTIQFIPRIRREFPVYHRLSGRVFFLASVGALVTGLLLAPSSFGGDLSSRSATWSIGILFAGSGVMGLLRAVQRRIPEHKRWMLRMYAAGSSVVYSRVVVGALGTRLQGLGLWGTMTCEQIVYELRDEPGQLRQYFPGCQADPGELIVAVRAGKETTVHIIMGLRMAFSVGLWIGLLLNMLLAELLIHYDTDQKRDPPETAQKRVAAAQEAVVAEDLDGVAASHAAGA